MPPESTPSDQWPISTYWREPDERISQHWYISFCLMMSAVQDYLTGLCLQQQGNLNWATTCYYYSLVHTGRLLAFCIVGDFPRQHDKLRNLYKAAYMPTEWKAEPSNKNEQKAGDIEVVPFNWLNGFLNRKGARNSRIGPQKFSTRVSGYLNHSDNKDLDELRLLAGHLNRLGVLRSDANYESLIIAHEKHHNLVSGGFGILVKAANSAASEAVSLAINVYKVYVNTSLLLNDHREALKLISDQYVTGRLYICLLEKMGANEEAKEKLESLCKSLKFDITGTEELRKQAEQIEQKINLEQFDSKQSLMKEFLSKINNLENIGRIKAEE